MAFGFDAISVIRSNRSLLKRTKFKDVKNIIIETSGKTELELKQVSKEELTSIKEKIRKRARKTIKIEIALYGAVVLILLAIAVYLFFQLLQLRF